MNNTVAIAIFVYNRPDHAQKVFQGLKNNIEFKSLPVIIYGDGKRNSNDKNWDKMKKVAEEFAEKNSNVELIYRKENLGCRISIIDGISQTLNRYDSVIVIEDDIYTSKAFLNFMLQGLEFYKNIKEIACICGYNHPSQLMKIPADYYEDIYFSLRTGSWGWATWKDRWFGVDWELKDFDNFKSNRQSIKEFQKWGSDLFSMLKAQANGKINAWDIAWTYHCFEHNLYTVYPVMSFVENIGHDGSGENSKASDKKIFENKNLNQSKKITFIKEPYINFDIAKNFRKVYQKNVNYYYRKIMSKLMKLLYK